MSRIGSITEKIRELKAGDSDAAEEIVNRYLVPLVQQARRMLVGSPKRVADEEDVVLMAFNDFLEGVEDRRFAKLEDREDLRQILMMLTKRKAIAQRRQELAQKRGGGEVRGESVFAASDGAGSQKGGLAQWARDELTPVQAVEFTEKMRRAFESLDDDDLSEILLSKLAGYTNKEIAEKLGISLSGVERKLRLIRRKWESDGLA